MFLFSACGEPVRSGRIINGTETVPGAYPWAVGTILLSKKFRELVFGLYVHIIPLSAVYQKLIPGLFRRYHSTFLSFDLMKNILSIVYQELSTFYEYEDLILGF